METSKPRTNDHASRGIAGAGNASKDLDLEEEDVVVPDDDVSDFFDETDANPGDRRRDPLRRG